MIYFIDGHSELDPYIGPHERDDILPMADIKTKALSEGSDEYKREAGATDIWDPATLEMVTVNRSGHEVRRWSQTELMLKSPAHQQLFQRMATASAYKARYVCHACVVQFDVLIPAGQSKNPILCPKCHAIFGNSLQPKPKEVDVGVNGDPPLEQVRDIVTGETYIFVKVTKDNIAIGRDRFGTEYALPPYGWERFGGHRPPPTLPPPKATQPRTIETMTKELDRALSPNFVGTKDSLTTEERYQAYKPVPSPSSGRKIKR